MCACAETESHPITQILLDQSTVKDVRFSVSKLFWVDLSFYTTLEDRVCGTFKQWTKKAEFRVSIRWDDTAEETLSLSDFLPALLGFKLEPYADNRLPPKANRRRMAEETVRGQRPAAAEAAQPEVQVDKGKIDVLYTCGARQLQQTWFYEAPEAIGVDERQEQRQRPQINANPAEYRTPYLMWQNVCLPWQWVVKMFDHGGYINQRLSGKDNTFQHRKTTIGEGIQWFGYQLGIANNPGTPVRAMWQDKHHAGEKRTLPPPCYGRFGMSENRFFRLEGLLAAPYPLSEAGMDNDDPWRYCRLAVNEHNSHWEKIYSPSWLLAPDEGMSPWTAAEGARPQDIPFLSHVPRKPKPLGAELKSTADGDSGAIIRLEFALEFKRVRGQPNPEVPFADEWGATAAQCMRLVKPWLNTGRCFGGDAHFISVDSVEAMRLNVCLINVRKPYYHIPTYTYPTPTPQGLWYIHSAT